MTKTQTIWFENIQFSELSGLLDFAKAGSKSPFLSRAFLESWFCAKKGEIHGFALYDNSQLKHFVLIGESITNHFGLQIRSAHLNQSGLCSDNQIWIEYNDLFSSASSGDQFPVIFINALFEELAARNYHQLQISMGCSSLAKLVELSTYKLSCVSTEGFIRTLLPHSSVDEIITTLSSKSRTKIRRSIRKLEESFGPIKLDVAESNSSIEQFFSGLSSLHKQKWNNTVHGSGFSNTTFKETLLKLLVVYPQSYTILRFSAGNVNIGYCLYFLGEKSVYFYCSGVNHAIASSHIKPGYVIHLFAMSYFSKRNFLEYDFMGGDSQYKRTLCDKTSYFYSVDIPLKNAKGYLILLFRHVKPVVRSITQFFSKHLLDSHQQ